jgi:hypothetical protein
VIEQLFGEVAVRISPSADSCSKAEQTVVSKRRAGAVITCTLKESKPKPASAQIPSSRRRTACSESSAGRFHNLVVPLGLAAARLKNLYQ